MKIKLSVIAVLLTSSICAAAQSTITEPVTTANNSTASQNVVSMAKPISGREDWTKTWSVVIIFNSTFDSNLEHDVTPVRAAGFAPSVVAGYQLRSKHHRVRFIYGLSASRYTRSTDLNRVGQYFGTSYRFSLGRWSSLPSGTG